MKKQKVTTMSKIGNKVSSTVLGVLLACGDTISNIKKRCKIHREHRLCSRPLFIWRNVKGIFKRPKLVFTFGDRMVYSQRYCNYTPTWSITMPGADYDYMKHKWFYKDWALCIYKALHLTWIKPHIELPYWCYIGFYKQDAGWKSKWGEYRYEDTPPMVEVSLFKWSLCWSWHAPIDVIGRDYDILRDCHYWESIMEYLWGNHQEEGLNTLQATAQFCGQWGRTEQGKKEIHYWQLQPDFLEQPYADMITDFEWKEDSKNFKKFNK